MDIGASLLQLQRRVPFGDHVRVGFAARRASARSQAARGRAGRAPTPRRRERAAKHRRASARPRRRAPRRRELPIAISTLRTNRARPMRLTALLANSARNAGVVEPRQFGKVRRAAMRRAPQASFRARPARICSTDKPPGNRRSHRCGCRSAGAARAGSGPCARWSDRRCSAAHRGDRAPEMPPSGRCRGRRGRCRNGRAPASSGGSSSVVKMAPRNSHEPYSRDTRLVCLPCQPRPAAAASGFSITGAVSTNTLTSPPACSISQRPRAFSRGLITS